MKGRAVSESETPSVAKKKSPGRPPAQVVSVDRRTYVATSILTALLRGSPTKRDMPALSRRVVEMTDVFLEKLDEG